MGVTGVFLAQYTIIPIVHAFLGDNANYLKTQIDGLIPARAGGAPRELSDEDIVTADVLFPAWDFTNSGPVFFSKTIARM